jgi:hypothetical protein
MILRTVRTRSPRANHRLDSQYFCSPGTQAHERLAVAKASGIPTAGLGGSDGLARVSAPNRFTRAYAAADEESVPYLRPYDVFEYLPQAADRLSVRRTRNLATYQVTQGTILQSCSGRNLGPAVFVDRYLESFTLSHDMIRIHVSDPGLRDYVLAFLNTPTAQALLRRDKTGSVIDHISPSHVAALEVPLFDERFRAQVGALLNRASQMREEARLQIRSVLDRYEQELPSPAGEEPRWSGWTQPSRSLFGRLDAACHDPFVVKTRRALSRAGGLRCNEVASVTMPGRYVRYYVEKQYGEPILSGRQLLQLLPVNLQYISSRSFSDASRYRLQEGWVALQAEGRAEERIAFPVMVTPDRNGWLANNHIARVVPRDGVEPGSLFVAMACQQVQRQVKALATGSVVDAVNVSDLREVILVLPNASLGASVRAAWGKFSAAQRLQDGAVAELETALSAVAGEEQRTA